MEINKLFLVYTINLGRDIFHPLPQYAPGFEDQAMKNLLAKTWEKTKANVVQAENPRAAKIFLVKETNMANLSRISYAVREIGWYLVYSLGKEDIYYPLPKESIWLKNDKLLFCLADRFWEKIKRENSLASNPRLVKICPLSGGG